MPSLADNHPASGSSAPLHVAIIGGGITGINLALGLERRGVSYTVYERSPGLREIGAGIGFSPNAEEAMKLLNPDIFSTYKRTANPNGEDKFQWINGLTDELLYSLPVPKDGFLGCKRSEILEEWGKLVPPEKIRFNKTVQSVLEPVDEGYDTNAGGKVLVKFTDGSTEKADLVIGCDGIRSRLRTHINTSLSPSPFGPTAKPSYTHKFCYRALIPMPLAVEAVGQYRTSTRFMYNGPGAHIITYPVGNNSVLNILAVISDANEWADEKIHVLPGNKDDIRQAFKNFHPTVQKLAELFPEKNEAADGPIIKWGIFDTYDYPLSKYFAGRVAVAGDAAHATGPHLGAGGGLGIEDALLLAELLHKVTKLQASDGYESEVSVDKSLERALCEYNEFRYKRTQQVVRMTRDAVDLFQWKDEKVAKDGKKYGKLVTQMFHYVWHDVDLKEMVDSAKRGLEWKVLEAALEPYEKEMREAMGGGKYCEPDEDGECIHCGMACEDRMYCQAD
ncbi:FAD/NAD(P)-binding domain-containing protein [Sordaria brevicollis]|uniref:FAD/NAD(P)-binding domain-containing protein n=1 Tax=Sordaria brevicollis TaxID=83679 RepID=A0AAE0UD10_SORBR|nr:FAD/NAD(P)-binding domain-containing protein [Sordaria brevicollis]